MNYLNEIDFENIPPAFVECIPNNIDDVKGYVLDLIKNLIIYIDVNHKCVLEIETFNGSSSSGLRLDSDDVEESMERYKYGAKFNIFLIAHLAKKANLNIANIENFLKSELKGEAGPYIEIVKNNDYLAKEIKK